ncbi:hypothetical protein DPMN_109782 [Dreissena polymorpha]|uniref:Uncharacterized protein n=1 Tax=Dreissena polymorpha TaxID=45954 RepID=A0A9D4KBN9_DREPO|nr:hypothetical protein DPMN_109782 [Dreissena polymorpha]
MIKADEVIAYIGRVLCATVPRGQLRKKECSPETTDTIRIREINLKLPSREFTDIRSV